MNLREVLKCQTNLKNKKMVNKFKYIIFVISVILFCNCQNNIDKSDFIRNDTIISANGYSIIFDDNSNFKKAIKEVNKDTFCIDFYHDETILSIKKENGIKRYFFNNINGLYKIKHKIDDYSSINEFQTVHIDSTSPNFMIKPLSDFISIIGLKDTIRVNEKLIININTYDSIFPFFKLYIINSDKKLSLNYGNVSKSKPFRNKKGILDTLTFKKSGTYYYQGFIENYMILKDLRKASVDNYFRKKIVVR